MRKMFQLLIVLYIIYFGIEFIFNFFGNGYEIKYSINSNDKEYNIREVLSLNNTEKDNYLIEVSFDNNVIPFKIYQTYSKRQKIVSEVLNINVGGYNCLKLVLNEDNDPSDLKCLANNMVYNYNDLIGYNAELDSKIKEIGYDYNKYTSNYSDKIKKYSNLEIYPSNFPKNMYLVLDHYKGIYLMGRDENVNNYIRTFQFFNQDVYNKNISAIVDKYYIVANYNTSHEFHEYNVINLKIGDHYKFKTDDYISYNSFVQGVYDKKLYIVDIDAKLQYAIDPAKRTTTIVNDLNNNVEVYINGKKELKSITEVINNRIVFDNDPTDYNGIKYDRIILVGNEDHGTYYLFSRNGEKYDVYAVYAGSEAKTYVFSTTSKDRIQISDEYIYYLDDDKIMVYSSSYGKKIVAQYSELKYNLDLKYLVY